jgi:intraflagellar transport protein 56
MTYLKTNRKKNVFPIYQGPKSSLQTRLLFHLAFKNKDEEKFGKFRSQLQNNPEDQMCLASMHYMKNQYQDALDIYKQYLVQNRYYNYLSFYFYTKIC